jgi:hypothetical protein
MINECECPYCIKQGFLWVLEGKLWIEIPKNGSSSIKNLQKRKLKKADNNDIENLEWFFVYRNPIERFKSLVYYYFFREKSIHHKKENPYIKSAKRFMEKNNLGEIKKETIFSILLEKQDKIKELCESHHFNSQCSFFPKNIEMKNYQALELCNLGEKIPCHINKSDKVLEINEDEKGKIMELYRDDYEFFYNLDITFN